MKLKRINIDEESCYYGNIVDYAVSDDKRYLRIWVEIDDFPGIKFLKSVRYSEYMPSPMATLLEALGVLESNGKVDFNSLNNMEVVVNFNMGNDGSYYINEMELYEGDEVDDEE